MDATAIATYGELIRALRSRLDEINSTLANTEAITGLASGYCGKLLSDNPSKTLGAMSLFALLGGLALRLRLEPDDDALAQLQQRSDWMPMRRRGPRYRRSPGRRPHGREQINRGTLCQPQTRDELREAIIAACCSRPH